MIAARAVTARRQRIACRHLVIEVLVQPCQFDVVARRWRALQLELAVCAV